MTSQSVRSGNPFRLSSFRLYYLGQSISFLGDGIVPMTFAFAALAVSDSGWGMPIVLLSLWGTRMLLIAPGGNVSDKYNRVTVMVVADLVRLLAQIIPVFAFITNTATLWHLGISAALYGVGTAFYIPASIGLLPRIVPKESLQKANSWIDLTLNTGLLAGPALATILVSLGGIPTALLFDIATFLVSIACLSFLFRLSKGQLLINGFAESDDDKTAESVNEKKEDEIPPGFLNGLRLLPRYPGVLWLMLLSCPVQLSIASISVLGPIIARDSLGGIAFWASLATALAAGGLVGSFLAGWVKVKKPVVLVLVVLAICQPIQLVLFGLGLNIIVLAVSFAATAILVTVAGILFDTYVQMTVPDSALSRVGSIEQTLMSVMVPIGFAVSLPMAQWMGSSQYLYLLAAVIACCALIAMFFLFPRQSRIDESQTRMIQRIGSHK